MLLPKWLRLSTFVTWDHTLVFSGFLRRPGNVSAAKGSKYHLSAARLREQTSRHHQATIVSSNSVSIRETVSREVQNHLRDLFPGQAIIQANS